jgi:hypothetical protein
MHISRQPFGISGLTGQEARATSALLSDNKAITARSMMRQERARLLTNSLWLIIRKDSGKRSAMLAPYARRRWSPTSTTKR